MSVTEVSAIEKLNTSAFYRYDEPFFKILREYRNIEICTPALDWCEAQYAQNRQATYYEVMLNFLNDPDAPEEWARMNLMVFGEMLDDLLLNGYMMKIKNPHYAITTRRFLITKIAPEKLEALRDVYIEKLNMDDWIEFE